MAGVLLAGAAQTPAYGASTLSLFDASAPNDSVTVNPGDAFTLTVRLNTDKAFLGFSAYLEDRGYAGAPRFTITNRTRLATNPFTAGQETTDSPDFDAEPIDDKTLDLGYVRGSSPATAGQYDLMTVQITAANSLAGGQYFIGFDPGSVLVDANFQPVEFDNLAAAYTVTVIPEPAGLAIAGAGLLGLLIRVRRPSTSRQSIL